MSSIKNIFSKILYNQLKWLYRSVFNTLSNNKNKIKTGFSHRKKPQIVHATKQKTIYGHTKAMPVEFPTGFT